MYTIGGKAQLIDLSGTSQKPVSIMDTFHSQFALDTNVYRDNNNFVKHNTVKINDNRVFFFLPPQKYEFLDVVMGPVFLSSPYVR